jgi:hypothetical protein
MPSNCEYYLYQLYIRYGNNGEFYPVYPPEYAISGDTGQNPVIKRCDSPNCGYYQPQYRWHQEDISEDYICSGGNKYYKEIYQVSYDNGFNWENVVPEQTRQGSLYESGSSDCIEYRWVNMDISTDYICDECPDLEYRWIATTGYVCSGTNKMTKEIEQVSYDSGTTWQNVVPEESRAALPVIEYDSTDCGYVPTGYSTQYLTFIPVSGSSTFQFTNSVDYSLDNGSTWATLAANTPTPIVNAGEKIMWKATLTPNYGIGRFSSTGQFNVECNAMSLLYGDNFVGQTSLAGKNYAFNNLFSGCTNVVSAENLILPATTLAQNCYSNMFQGCTSLRKAPKLPATTLAQSCYYGMFAGCTSLTTAPQLPAATLVNECYMWMFQGCTSLTTAPSILPATTLTDSCYSYMFRGCTSLTEAPELPATTLVDYCYFSMFYGCTNLNNITCLATNISAISCTTNWVYNVSSTGTFTKASSMTGWSIGISGIPSNWTIANA